MTWGYWPGCYRTHTGMGLLARQLQPTGGTGLAATSPRLAWSTGGLLHAAGWPGGTGLAAAAHRGYWPCCYKPQDSLGVLAWLLQAPGVLAWLLPGLLVCLGILAWLLHAPGWPGDTGVAATGPKLAWGTGLAAACPRFAWGYRPG